MLPVEDRLHDHVVAAERRAHDPWLAMVQRPHGVEEMRNGADAAVEGEVGLGSRRARVAE